MMIMAKLKYLVIHCTATPEGREVSSADIRKWHTSPVAQGGRGWKQVGYTDLFHLNGGVERLVENNEDAQVDPWEVTNGAKGYNQCKPSHRVSPEAWKKTVRPRKTPAPAVRKRHWRSM